MPYAQVPRPAALSRARALAFLLTASARAGGRQVHYPFERKEEFETKLFPADFIAEGLDQTRGWFYTVRARVRRATTCDPAMRAPRDAGAAVLSRARARS